MLQSELLPLLRRRVGTFGSHILHDGFFSMVAALKFVPDRTGHTTQFGLGPLAFVPYDPTELQRIQQRRDDLSLAISTTVTDVERTKFGKPLVPDTVGEVLSVLQ
jgi:hypothetical protein